MSEEMQMQLVSAYTSGNIEADQPIYIMPTKALRKMIDTCRCRIDNVFHFEPHVDGTAHFGSGLHNICFTPDKGSMGAGKHYTCRIDMSELTNIDTMPDIVINLYTIQRQAAIDDILVNVDPDDAKKAVVRGRLRFNIAPQVDLEKSGLLKCSAKEAIAKITATDDDKLFNFEIKNIPVKNKDYTTGIRFETVDGRTKATAECTIPQCSTFRYLYAKHYTTQRPYIDIAFSQHLDTKQDPIGLVEIDGIDDIRIERRGANIRLYYTRNSNPSLTLNISRLLRSSEGAQLGTDISIKIKQEVIPPAIEVPISGSILPDGKNLKLPFRAVNLAAIDVNIVKIYSDNVLCFLQNNELDDTYGLHRVGRHIYRKTVRLDTDPKRDLHQWQNFSIDLTGLFRQEPGVVYCIQLSFRQAYSLYGRNTTPKFDIAQPITAEDAAEWDNRYYFDWEAPDYNWWQYNWNKDDDPSSPSYYMVSSRMPVYNIMASNLGIIVKRSDDNKLWIAVADIMTTRPLGDVKVSAYNYQMQEIATERTDKDGFVLLTTDTRPFFITATDGRSVSYLKVNNANAKSLSAFDTSGKRYHGNIKGFTYADRGVHRPGDDIYLTLIVDDKSHPLPQNHPVVMELYTPDRKLYDRQTLTKSIDHFYHFTTRTDSEAQTGIWKALFRVGDTEFDHTVRIEEIKPNRLKIRFDIPDVVAVGQSDTARIDVEWLNGAVAKQLNASIDVHLYADNKPFKHLADFTFKNPLLKYDCTTQHLPTTRLDDNGRASWAVPMPTDDNIPGVLQANYVCSVEEAGGDVSIESTSLRYSPFESYVGIDLSDNYFVTDRDLRLPIIAVDIHGNTLNNHPIAWSIYKLSNDWWWEYSASNLNRYVEDQAAELIASDTIITSRSKSYIPFRVDYPQWGNYLILATDMQSGHRTGGIFVVDWPDWRGRADLSKSKASSILKFTIDKKEYLPGDWATVYLPAAPGGRALISIENGNEVIERYWVTTDADNATASKFLIKPSMAPNFYVHTTLIQPHSRTVNNMPIRMYGVQSARVVDPTTILHPVISAPKEVRPFEEFTVSVSEINGRAMTYTLAIVDEGLLDISSFRTPNPWQTMNRRQALGINTWDIYDDVIGAYAGHWTTALSIGGDMAIRASEGKAKRFNPVVKYLGPFTMKKGVQKHKITLPMYTGSLRAMVVAAHDGAYGNAETNIKVNAPVAILPTLPRTLACADTVAMPVNLFADAHIHSAVVTVAVDGPVSLVGDNRRRVVFNADRQQLESFTLACDPIVSGTAHITITAAADSYKATETIAIEVNNPHSKIVTTDNILLTKGKNSISWTPEANSNVDLTIASTPNIDYNEVLNFVLHYPYSCSEQLASKAMFMLYSRKFLPQPSQQLLHDELPNTIRALLSRQKSDGGFVYWPRDSHSHQWVSSMVGQVIVEAQRQGFAVPQSAIDAWTEYQKNMARKYQYNINTDLTQAYRLYTLALAHEHVPAAMNRLKENTTISRSANYCLAAAYQISGNHTTALQLLDRNTTKTNLDYGSFYSQLRNDAIRLEALILVGKTEQAMLLARDISKRFVPNGYNTQELAFVCLAMNRLTEHIGVNIDGVNIECGNRSRTISSLSSIAALPLDYSAAQATITTDAPLFASLAITRQPRADEDIAAQSSGVKINVTYADLTGKPINVNNLTQGDNFFATIIIKNIDGVRSDNMALTYKIPSGWEIWNERLIDTPHSSTCNNVDIRDDRSIWYFALDANATRQFTVRLRAAYVGRFTLPAAVVEDMYRPSCRATTASKHTLCTTSHEL